MTAVDAASVVRTDKTPANAGTEAVPRAGPQWYFWH